MSGCTAFKRREWSWLTLVDYLLPPLPLSPVFLRLFEIEIAIASLFDWILLGFLHLLLPTDEAKQLGVTIWIFDVRLAWSLKIVLYNRYLVSIKIAKQFWAWWFQLNCNANYFMCIVLFTARLRVKLCCCKAINVPLVIAISNHFAIFYCYPRSTSWSTAVIS